MGLPTWAALSASYFTTMALPELLPRPELGVKRTSISSGWMSACSHKRSFEQSAATVEFCPCRRYYQARGKMKQTIQWHHTWRRLGVAALLFCVLESPAGAWLRGVTPPSAPAVLTLHEAASFFLWIGSDELERLTRRNEVPAWRIGTHWRFDRVGLLAAEAATANAFKAEDLEKLKETGRCIECDLFGAKLSLANLPGVNLSGADLSRASLTGADLSGANLSGANLTGAYLSGADLSGGNLKGANLSWARLISADLSRADLSGANLSEANLGRAKLSGANLSEANFHGVSLVRANLAGINLVSADLSRADLSRADLSDANLGKAKLIGANLVHADLSRADLSGANLSKANLEGANLIQTNLTGADLNGASLVRAEPIGADLSGANLQRANLNGADLRFAVLIGTNLTGALLHAANLDGAKGLTLRQLDHACGDAKTKLSPNLSVRTCP